MDGNTFFIWFEPLLMEWLQSHLGRVGVWLASVITMFGEELVLIALLGFIYWCWDKEFGKLIGINIVTAVTWNPLVKNIFLRRRPYFDHEGVECLKPVDASADIYDIAAQGYSFPSGHSTNAACVYGTLPFGMKHKVFKIVAIVLPLIVGISRVALGVHYPTDVLAGWLMGGLIAVGLTLIQRKVKNKWLLYLIIFLISLPGVFYCVTDDYYTALGIMAGLFLAIAFEEKFVHFENTRIFWRAILRIIGGFALYFGLNFILKLPFDKSFLESGTMAAHLVRSCRYMIIVFLLIGVYPWTFDGKLRQRVNPSQ